MKVETNLKAGGLVQDVYQGASQVTQKATEVLVDANRQAEDFTRGAVNAASNFFNRLSNILTG